MKIYRVAIIGLGGMGNNHALAVQAEDDCQLVGGAEVDVGRACSWKERFKVDAVFDSYEKMFDQLEPDIVINATQSPLHYAPTLAAARRGIHIFCEKPMARDLVQADEMVQVCDQHKVKLAINHIKRASLYNAYALNLIQQGEIGQLIRLRAADKGGRKSGNALMAMGTHLFDWMRLFAGDVEWAHAHLLQLDGRESTVYDIKDAREINPRDQNDGLVLGERGFASFRFKSGVHAEADFRAETPGDDRGYGIDLIGTQGHIALRESVGTAMFIHRGQHHLPQQGWEQVHIEEEDNDERGQPHENRGRLFLQRLMLRDLIAAIEEDRDPAASGRGGVASMEMINLTWESHRRQERVYAPLAPRDHPLERWQREEGVNS